MGNSRVRNNGIMYYRIALLVTLTFFIFAPKLQAQDVQGTQGILELQQLINEALNKNPEINSSHYQASAAEYRVPQVKSLPDPMFTFGYQNEGFKKYTYGQSDDAQWMFTGSQTFPFPGKLALKGEAAKRESESLSANYEALRLKTVTRVKELYFDLYSTYKNLDLIQERTSLFKHVEDAALARYSTAKGSQQEVLMAQTEKYMLLEKEEMLRQKIQSIEAALNTVVGRPADAPLGRPVDRTPSILPYTMNELIKIAVERSPEIASKEKMIKAAEARVAFAKKDYIPDMTIAGSYFARGNGFEDMWSLTSTINLPIFFMKKQRHAVNEAEASLNSVRSDKESMSLTIASAIRDNYTMFKATENLMSLYKDGLIPKSRQDVELALSGYRTGSVDALTVITRLKTVIDFEISYWSQFAEHEKAMARIESIANLPGAIITKNAGK